MPTFSNSRLPDDVIFFLPDYLMPLRLLHLWSEYYAGFAQHIGTAGSSLLRY